MDQFQNNRFSQNSQPQQKQESSQSKAAADTNAWMNNPALQEINPAKLQMLASLASQAQGKKQNELLPFLMAAASQSNTSQMTFDNDEIDAVISVMKLGKSPQEIQQIDRLCALVKQFRKFSH